MIYKTFKGQKISQLAFGTMRLPILNGKDTDIDQEQVQRMVDDAIANGVNYFDTAWGYHNGASEVAIGKALKKYPRDSYILVDKFPGYDLANINKVEEIFAEQLKRCDVDYFDFYHIHNVHELNIEQYLDPKYRIYDYLTKMKEEGKIKHLGFSAHAGFEVFKRFLDKYGDSMEFCQIQLNYLDYNFQDAKLKVEELNRRGIPILVMEPLRGGRLSNFSETELAIANKICPGLTGTQIAFRYLQSIPGILSILSGMSNEAQMKDNLKTFQTEEPLNDSQKNALYELAEKMLNAKTEPCTACRYCTGHCPMELDIPKIIAMYNQHVFTGGGWEAGMGFAAMPENKWPSACIGCGACQSVCPQSIKIPEIMDKFAKMIGQK